MRRIRFFTRRTGSLVGLLAALLFSSAGCTGPNLRALSQRDAKIDVYPNGTVHVLGEPVELDDLAGIVWRSATRETDTILIRLHGDPESPELTQMRRLVTDQMIQAKHFKFNFFSQPLATIQTYDPTTRRMETYALKQPVETLSREAAKANADKLIAETEAYSNGTYVSDAVDQKPVAIAVGSKPEELSGQGRMLAEAQSPADKQAAGAAAAPSQEAMREAWKRQQRSQRNRSR